MLFASTLMQLAIIILNEVSQKEEDKYHMISYMTQLNLSMKQKQNHGRREQICGCWGGGVQGGMD